MDRSEPLQGQSMVPAPSKGRRAPSPPYGRRFGQSMATLSRRACAVEALARFATVMWAQLGLQAAVESTLARFVTGPLPNPSIERTSTGWARYARCSFSASRAQPVPASHVKR
jgi:hypothetical protein